MEVGRIIQLTDANPHEVSRTRRPVVEWADVVIAHDGTIIKNRHGVVGEKAPPELLEQAIEYPEAQDEVDDLMQVLNNMRDRGATLPEIQGAIDRYVSDTYGAANAIKLIAAERVRQIDVEGYDERHDDGHDTGELVAAAIAYAAANPGWWPWARNSFNPGDNSPEGRLGDLVKAGALICAEIDRLQRISDSADGA